MVGESLLYSDRAGVYCERGGFHVDPWLPSARAVITHAHSDHARSGCGEYFCSASCEPLLRIRMGPSAVIRGVPYGERFRIGDATLSFHPAGHVRGSAQVRIEGGEGGCGDVWVASGDYKRCGDPTAEAFEVVKCDVFITEATFALPVYRWREGSVIGDEMLAWWEGCQRAGKSAVLLGYSLGKVQRALAEIMHAGRRAGRSLGKVYMHGAASALTRAYRAMGVELPEVEALPEKTRPAMLAGSLTVAPPGSEGTPWIRRFGASDRFELAFASGWMHIRGVRRRGGHDRGFALSDHADWQGLNRTIDETGAARVLVTHGNIDSFVRYLRERGVAAEPLRTVHGGEED
ncbi:MAG TPA: ligase-associated DNA damage response exonuclease [Phycisphaerales bacterium]|nr:ligase-associated DNA damage response exonuclease [Phycisphaerales bacterium]